LFNRSAAQLHQHRRRERAEHLAAHSAQALRQVTSLSILREHGACPRFLIFLERPGGVGNISPPIRQRHAAGTVLANACNGWGGRLCRHCVPVSYIPTPPPSRCGSAPIWIARTSQFLTSMAWSSSRFTPTTPWAPALYSHHGVYLDTPRLHRPRTCGRTWPVYMPPTRVW
jgi:hypothetical protein